MKITEILTENYDNQSKRLIDDPFLITQLYSIDPVLWSNNQVKKAVVKYIIEGIQSVNTDYTISAAYVFDTLRQHQCPWPELDVLQPHIDKIINSETTVSELYLYVETVMREKPWPLIEHRLLSSPEWAYYYARYILKSKWPAAEPVIMKSPEYAFQYARAVLKQPWPEAEPYIMQNPVWAVAYVKHILKGRWPEAEPIIMSSPLATEYKQLVAELGRWN